MAIGVVGRKCGMTRVFTPEGESIPVTVIEVTPNRVTQVKSAESDGYGAVQVTFGERRASRVTKPAAGHFAKAGVDPAEYAYDLSGTLLYVTPGELAEILLDTGLRKPKVRFRRQGVVAVPPPSPAPTDG